MHPDIVVVLLDSR